jgi:hypothetical protein
MMRRISEFSTKQTFVAIFSAYFAFVIVLALFCFLIGWREMNSIGKAFLYTGVIFSVLGLLVLTQAGWDRKSAYDASPFMQNQDYQRQSIRADKPYRTVISIIIFAALLVAGTGYFLMYLSANLLGF